MESVLRGALEPLFGANTDAYLAEVERHQAEARELIDRARRVTQELINAALDRLTFFGGDRAAFFGEANTNTQAQRAEVDKELHEALVEARERHNRRVEALRLYPEE
jgi:replicative DNA helicase